MRIIKQGDLNRLKEIKCFKCKACGCVFEADSTEYRREYSKREMRGWYAIICPTCDRWVTTEYDNGL